MTLAAVSLSLGDYAVIGGMLIASTTALVFNLKVLTRRVEVVERHAKELGKEKVGKDEWERIDRRVAGVEQGKVAHKDWVRVATSQVNRQEQLSRQLAELGGKLDATIGIGTGMHRVAQALEKQAQR